MTQSQGSANTLSMAAARATTTTFCKKQIASVNVYKDLVRVLNVKIIINHKVRVVWIVAIILLICCHNIT